MECLREKETYESTKSGFSLNQKDRVKLKILFGIEG